MYTLINENIDAILKEIKPKTHIDPYVKIQATDRDITSSDFQATFKTYYGMNVTGLSATWLEKYFDLLYTMSKTNNYDLRSIVEYLWQIPVDDKEKHALHFSFSTKILHALDKNSPVYDSFVASFYFLRKPSNKSIDTRIDNHLKQYEFLKEEYKRILDEDLLETSITEFKKKFNKNFSDIKIVDTLLWRYVGFCRSGAFVDGRLKHS